MFVPKLRVPKDIGLFDEGKKQVSSMGLVKKSKLNDTQMLVIWNADKFHCAATQYMRDWPRESSGSKDNVQPFIRCKPSC